MANEYIDKETAEKKEKKKQTKEKKSKTKKSAKASKSLMQIVNGDFLNKEFVLNNLTYIFFVMLLLIILIGKGYYVSQLSKDIENTEKEVNQMTSDYVEAKAKLEEQTRRVKLVEKLNPKGLKETLKPTKVIRIKKEEE